MKHDPLVLMVPGLGGSSGAHWQALWARQGAGFAAVEQDDWDAPDPEAWTGALADAVARAGRPVVLAAHSLGCALVARWAGSAGEAERRAVRAAFLVAPADVDSPENTPEAVRCFAPMPLHRLPFPSVVAASRDDPYVAFDRAALFAESWLSEFRDLGSCGHVNAGSGHGPWPAGRAILDELLARVREHP